MQGMYIELKNQSHGFIMAKSDVVGICDWKS